MTIDEVDVKQKQIIITHIEKNNWDVKFNGLISRADMIKIGRLLTVKFAVVSRQRSIDRRKRQVKESLETESKSKSKPDLMTPTNDTNDASDDNTHKKPVTEKSNVSTIYRP